MKGKERQCKVKGLKSFDVFDLVLLAMLTAVSIAFKTLVGTLVRLITGPLGIPGGALAGGFYMLWLPLAIVLVGKRGSAFFIALVQTIVVITTGLPGSHGVWSLLTYLVPAILVELVFIYIPKDGYNVLHFIFSVILANVAGTFGSNLLFFRMSLYPLLFTLLAASLSGAFGGLLAYFTFVKVVKSGRLNNVKKNMSKHKTQKEFDDFDDDYFENPSESIIEKDKSDEIDKIQNEETNDEEK